VGKNRGNTVRSADRVCKLLGKHIRLLKLEPSMKVIVEMKTEMPVGQRGHALLEAEKRLRKLSPKYEVFLKPRGDINKLRTQLRGVKV
jgi:hypothetical protein